MKVGTRTSQLGAVFANLALGAAAVGTVSAVAVDWTAQQTAVALQKQQGYLFATLNDAVGNYMTVLYPQLTKQSPAGVDAIPAECANLPYRYGTSVATESVILQGKCKLTLPLATGGNHDVANAFQPTLADLKKLGLLDHGVSEVPALSTVSSVAGPDAAGAASSSPAPNGYAISIVPKCVGMGSSVATCSNTNKALTSSVINIQPFVESSYIQNFTALMWAAGPDSAISGPADASNVVAVEDRANPTGEFRSIQAGWIRDNPITRDWTYSTAAGSKTYARGVDNLVVMRNGYESAYWQLSRRDGSSPPTANWDFNGKDLTNVGNLTAVSISTSGDVQVGGNQTVEGNQTVRKNQVVEGDLTVGKISTFKDVINALSNLVVSGATELKGKLTVAGAASFKDDVTIDKTLLVKGSADITGKLTGSTAEFTGALTANALTIGSTKIGKDGTLLGSELGWGVTPNASCSTQYALAQSTDGKLQICRNNAWTSLITTEGIVATAPGVGTTCSPEGSAGRLPDGTLAVCKDGKWQSTAAGIATEGASCSVEGSLATGTASPSPGLILLGCKGGVWTSSVFAKPRLGYGQEGGSCQTTDELAVDNKSGYYTLLICEGGTWRTPGTQLLDNMELGKACKLNGVLASDIEGTGLLVCKNNVWSKITDPIGVGASCTPNGREITLSDGGVLQCINSVWTTPAVGEPCITNKSIFKLPSGKLPNGEDLYCRAGKWIGAVILVRADGAEVIAHSPVEFNGYRYYIYNEPGYVQGSGLFGPLYYTPQTMIAIASFLGNPGYETVYWDDGMRGWLDPDSSIGSHDNCTVNGKHWKRKSDTQSPPSSVEVCLPTYQTFLDIANGRAPDAWYGQGFNTIWSSEGKFESRGYRRAIDYFRDVRWRYQTGDFDHALAPVDGNRTWKEFHASEEAHPVIIRVKVL